jgi:hypothetical protein
MHALVRQNSILARHVSTTFVFSSLQTFPLSSSMSVWIKFCSAYMNGITIYLLDEASQHLKTDGFPDTHMDAFVSGEMMYTCINYAHRKDRIIHTYVMHACSNARLKIAHKSSIRMKMHTNYRTQTCVALARINALVS